MINALRIGAIVCATISILLNVFTILYTRRTRK